MDALTFGFVVLAVVVLSAIWVYHDATSNRIGRIEPVLGTSILRTRARPGFFNLSAGGWFIAVLGLWIVSLPAYLLKRQDLIDLARNEPVDTRNAAGKTILLGLTGTALLASAWFLVVRPPIPTCDAPEVTRLATQILREAPLLQLAGIRLREVTSPGEREYDRTSQRRVCRALARTSVGDETFYYSVEWHNRATGEIWVEILER